MMPIDWLDRNANRTLIDMSDDEKDLAVSLYMSMTANQDDVLAAIKDYFVEDMRFADLILRPDASCGKALKDSLYAAFEAEIQQDMDRHNFRVLPVIDPAHEAGHKESDFS